MQLEKQKNEMKRKEAWRVYGALLVLFCPFLQLHLKVICEDMIFICRCNKDLLECISQRAAGKCLYDRLKLFPGLLSPPRHPGWRINGRVATSHSSKQSCLFLNQFFFHQIFILYIFILNILCHHHLVLLFLFHMVLKVEFIIHTQ